ncbi:MAG: bis(5'-nucleosyl)-tetraphosphatase (symmetrical) YqeK [Lachnospiraceae bacterium]|nr:bis(5'-nucleosyl)-tetraphosphatase (symmetrical) YqeK [Lachnospiraceae bacterium]
MERELDSKRFEHTLGVEFTAAALAMRYGADVLSAQTAGLLHDCAKCLSDEKKISICEKNNITISDVERANPGLLHAKVGGFLAMSEYGIEDSSVINAIINHTTGRPGMDLLEKIIFTADYIEPGRRTAPHLGEIRYVAFTDLDQALLWILEDTLNYLSDGSQEIDPMTEQTYRYYSARITVDRELRKAAEAHHVQESRYDE